MYTKISLSGFERFFTAICIAISAINLIAWETQDFRRA